MFEVKGKFADPLITNDKTDPKAIKQIQSIADQPLAKDTHIAEMPDQHFGAGVSIGTSIRLLADRKNWQMSPTIISGDIGCGVLATEIKEKHVDLKKLDQIVTNNVPCGFYDNTMINHNELSKSDFQFIKSIGDKLRMPLVPRVKYDLRHALGTLGRGNHFIEMDHDKHRNNWIVIHCGSRHFGTDILKYYLSKAGSEIDYKIDVGQVHLIRRMKQEGQFKEIESAIQKYKQTHPKVHSQYVCLHGKDLDDYIHDMILGQKFAIRNRHIINRQMIDGMGFHVVDQFESIHNYFNPRDAVMRKGAVTAHDGERLIIPLNMRDGSLICIGKGNKDWNWTAPHGAGRALSRTKAKKVLNMDQYRNDMKGIYTSSVDPSTLDEAPEAYKPMDQIINTITPTAKIIDRIKPVYNYKAHGKELGNW